jgi:uncharacterized protein (TIGR00297 family)
VTPTPVSGVLAAAAIASAAYRTRALTTSGAVAACLVGAVVFDLGGDAAAGALITFFLTSTALGRWRRTRKEPLGFEKGTRRDAGQVLANGGVACLSLIAGRLCGHGAAGLAAAVTHRAATACFAAIAAANADTWGTEVGAALRAPARRISTGRPAAPGTSGAVSVPGTLASVAGALIVALWQPAHLVLIALSALAGSLVDSVLGATLQAQWRDPNDPERWIETPAAPSTPPDSGLHAISNDVVNACGTAAAAIIALIAGIR